jgi:hypothetical protein
VNSFGLERGGDVVAQGGDPLELDPGRRVQFVAGDRGPFGDVAQRNLDPELRQGVLHQPGIGHQLFLRFGGAQPAFGQVEEFQGRQLVITDLRR